MNRNRKRPSRFDSSPSNNMNYGGNRGGLSYNQNDVFSSRDLGPSSMQINCKTQEQLAFDAEFSKWEKSFEEWKKTFANHPDRRSYYEYENKFLEVRTKLLRKREQIYGVNQINQFDSMLSAADSMANSILNKFGDIGESSGSRVGSSYNSMGNLGGAGSSYNSMRGSSMQVPSLMSLNPLMENSGYQSSNFNRNNDRGWSNDRDRDRDRFDDRNRDRDRFDDRNKDRDRFGRRNMDNDRFGSRDRDRNDRFGSRDRDRNDSHYPRSGNRGFGGGRDGYKPLIKPSIREVEKELQRTDVYPYNRWLYIENEPRPPLVGKRAKKKNAKILRVIEMKRQGGNKIPEMVDNQIIRRQDIPFEIRLNAMWEEAQKEECPKLLPGSARRRLKNIKARNESTYTDIERRFLEYVNYVSEKRLKWFEAHPKEAKLVPQSNTASGSSEIPEL